MGRNYVSITITIISNITVLVSHNVICFGAMSYGVNKKAPPIVSPPLLSLTGFPPVFFCSFKSNTLSTFCSDQIIAKNNSFSKLNFSFQLIAGWFWFCFFVYVFLKTLFWSSVIIKLKIPSYLHIWRASYFASLNYGA